MRTRATELEWSEKGFRGGAEESPGVAEAFESPVGAGLVRVQRNEALSAARNRSSAGGVTRRSSLSSR